VVEITSDGVVWETVEVVGPTGPDTAGGWVYYEFDPAAIVPLTSTMQVRFIAEDAEPRSVVEAAGDDFLVRTFECSSVSTCSADVTGDGQVNVTDLGVVLANFDQMGGATFEDGDVNGDGNVDASDLGQLLAEFGAGCN